MHRSFTGPVNAYATLACRLFHAVARSAEAAVVVDSTKSPAAAALLLGMPLRASFIHLVRDPRATGYSWRRRQASDLRGTRAQIRMGYERNAATWLYWNAVAECVRRQVPEADWLRVRYEDLAESPEAVLGEIVNKFRLSRAGWPLRGQSLQLGTHHTVEGNPSRFQTGLRAVRPDNQWSTRMPAMARAVTVAVTAPLFVAYGYHRTPQSS
jgi:hypothetical protein